MTEESNYQGREQSLVKHLILQRYLRRFAFIIGSWAESITYIDCFAGPWLSRSDRFEDTSFAIATNELRAARNELARIRPDATPVELRCFFMEKTKAAYQQLSEYAASINDIEIATREGELEGSIDEILKFVNSAAKKTFPFVFIDPKGWTGFNLQVIQPLLQLKLGEVLINFMTEHIRRFIDSPHEPTRESFVRLFGDGSFRDRLEGLSRHERDEACVTQYMQAVQTTGKFPFASSAVVLHPEKARSHFHLIYLTRDPRGIEVFKEAERKSMPDMEAARARAQQRKRVEKTGQIELFSGDDVPSTHFESLRERYTSQAKASLLDQLKTMGKVEYDVAWSNALRLPLVWESDLKEWLREWTKAGIIHRFAMEPKQRVPKLGQHIQVVWNRDSKS